MNGIDIDDGDFEDFRARNLSSRQQRPVTGRTFMKLKTGDETSDINNASTTTDHSSYFQQQTSQDNSRVASQNNLLQFSERNSVNSLHSRPRTAAASVVSTSRPLSSKAPKLPNTAGRYKGLSYDTIRAYEMEDIYNGETRGEESWVDEFSKSPSQPAKSRPNTSKSIQFNVTAATGNRVKSAATTAKSSCRPGTTASSRSFVVAKLLHSRKGSATSNSSAKAILPEDERDYDCIQVDTKRLFEGLNATFKIKEEVVQGKLSKLPQKRMKRPDYSEIVGSSPLINSSPGSRDQPRPSTIVQNLLLVNDGASNNKNRLSVMNTSASHIKRRSIAGGLVASASSSRRIGGSVSGEHHHQFIGNSRPSSAGKFRGSGTLSGNSTDDDDSGDEASTSKKRPGTSKNPTSKNLKPLLDRKDLMKFVKSCILNEESHHVLETLSGGHTSQTPSRPGTSKSTASSYVYHPRPYTAPIKPDPKKFMKRWVQSQGPKLRIQSAAMMREEAIDEKRELAPTIPNLKREGPPTLADFRHIKELNLFEDSKTKSEFTVKDFIKEYLHTIAKVQMRETGKLQKAGFINKHFRRSSSTVALNPGRSTVATPSQEMLKFLPPPMDENNDKHQQRRISHAQHPGAGTRRRTAIDMGTSVENNKHTLTTYALRKNGFDRNKVDIQLIFELMRPLQATTSLSDFILTEVCGVVHHVVMEAERAIFRQGEIGTAWYILLRGEVSVKISKTGKIEDNFTVAVLKAGQGFGELALINDAPRAATIITETRCELIKVESVDYKRIIKFNHEKDVKEKILFFKKFAIFSQWSFASLKTLAQISAIRKYPIGAALIIEGEEINEFFFIKKGSCNITKTIIVDGKRCEIHIDTVTTPAYVGEEAILTDVEGDTRAKASVYATSVKQSDTFTTEYLFDDQTDDVKPKRVKKAANSRPGSAINPADSSIEVLVFSVDDVRDRLKNTLVMNPHNIMSKNDTFEIRQRNQYEAQWQRLKTRMKTKMWREKFQDPNITLEKMDKMALEKKQRWK